MRVDPCPSVVDSPRRHFLPWDRPLLPQAAAWLAREWDAARGPLDLSGTLVIVPTRQSGRRLREALAEFAAAGGQAVFAPRVVTPEILVTQSVAAAGVASRLETLLAWTEIFRALAPADFREVFPVDPPARNFAWALRLAQTFARLQATLAEAGLRLADVSTKASADFPEIDRWRQLGELEKLFDAKLDAHGLRDEQAAKISAARNSPVPTGIRQIVVLATPDPLPLALDLLAAQARTCAVEIVVFAPESEARNFDAWGRPLPSAWDHRELALPDFARRVHLCVDPAAQAEMLAAAARDYAQPDGLLAVGITDAEVLPLLENELARVGVASFNPEGHTQREEPLYYLLAALAALAREPTFEAVAALLRCPDVLEFLHTRLGEKFSAAGLLAELDELHARHLPADLSAARAHAGEALAAAFAVVAELRDTLTSGAFPENATAAVTAVFAGRQPETAPDAAARFAESVGEWMKIVRACASAREKFSGLTTAEWWEVALPQFGDTRDRSQPKPAGALELQGILELLFEDAPHLAVAGFNDGCVPEGVVVGDPFLPESLRARLGLKTNAARFARDAYVVQAIAACRPRLDLLFGKTSAVGDPRRPSQLLLRCADADLPARVMQLFREVEPSRPSLPWTRAWRLTPPRRAAPARVSVTALRAWLDCPFRFYLQHVLGMRAIDPFKSELDAMDFGELVHRALEALGRDEKLHDCADAAVLKKFLLGELEKNARARFGAALTLPLVIQLESARQRLAKTAEIEARERAEGWRIVAVEKKFLLKISGLTVSGKIDRIDRHATTGAVRVLDYKTSDQPATPAAAHLRTLRRDEAPPPWAGVIAGEKPRVWADLQLPLYEKALAAEFGGGVTCGYFNLPKAVGETDVALWSEFTPELRESARRCAEGVCAAIRAGTFWPPRELTGREAEFDDFAVLFHEGAAASIAWEEAPA